MRWRTRPAGLPRGLPTAILTKRKRPTWWSGYLTTSQASAVEAEAATL